MPDHSLLPVLLVLIEAGDSVCDLFGGGKAAFILTAAAAYAWNRLGGA